MTGTKLRIIVPLLQVLILVLVFPLDPLLSKRYVTRSDLEVAYVITPEHLLLKLNFPLVVLGLPVIYLTRLPFSQASSPAGAPGAVIFGVYVLAIVASTAAFWYLVVVEVEMRKRRSSCLRFSGGLMERLKATAMILIGVGAAISVLWDGYRQFVVLDQLIRNHDFWSVFVVDTLIGGLFVIAWAAALITIGLQDITRVLGPR